MRPDDYPYHHDLILTIWQHYRQGKYQADDLPQEIDPLVIESWHRCEQFFQNKNSLKRTTSSDAKSELLHKYEDLVSIATPYMEDIYQLSSGAGYVVFLANSQASILSLEFDPVATNIYHRLGLGLGENWSEAKVGTNAIALTLITAMPTQVVGAEHYVQIFHDYGTTAAPIHDDKGEIIGTIGMISPVQQTDPAQLALMMETARAISNQLHSNLMLDQANQRLRQLDAIIESVTDGVITWDSNWRVDHINSTACQILGIRPSVLLGFPVETIMDLAPHVREAVANQQEISDVETMFQVGDRIVKCMISVRAIHSPQQTSSGGIAMLRPLSQVRNLVNQQAGSQAVLTFDNFYTKSAAIRKLLRQAEVAARASAPVLLSGESGVGKTSLAQAIHKASSRSTKPLVMLNCSAIPHGMVLSELLGIEAHGSDYSRPSKFELADGGTLILDQIDQLSLEGQAVLHQIIDTRHLMRLESKRATPVNVRVIATTDIDLDTLVEEESFSRQLYFRFSAFRLHIPSLRNRKEDIELLVRRFITRGDAEHDIEPAALEMLERYPWPGNIRELESVIERAVLHSEDNVIRPIDLPENVRTVKALLPQRAITQAVLTLQETEREAIMRAGWACEGVVSAMAEVLGINRSTLWRKMNQYGIKADDFK